MRIYLSKKEADLIRRNVAVTYAMMTPNQQDMVERIIDRIDLCEKLQQSERKAKDDANK